MLYYSTSDRALRTDFRTAVVKGQPDDGGLYFPLSIPQCPLRFLKSLPHLSREEIAFSVIEPYTGNAIPDNILKNIVTETVNFDFPLVPITSSISSLELFHGPTLAFKDVGARFLSRCLGYFAEEKDKKLTVLVATSGDTGGAVASAFYNVPGVDVVILYPSGKVSHVQELQLTTHGGNVTALEVEGNFDDCQRMVKQSFSDKDLANRLFLTSANSINIARWLPQQFYYFFAWKQWRQQGQPPVIAVPSGNFGNICAAVLAWKSGLPVAHFIAACNANDAVPEYFMTGKYEGKSTKQTLSNAMDVGNPSNFIRLLELFEHKLEAIRSMVSSCSISDHQTRKTIVHVKKDHNYLLDPHGAVGYSALDKYLADHPDSRGYFLETAHPVKFNDTMLQVTGEEATTPSHLSGILNKTKKSTPIKNDAGVLKEFLLHFS